MQNQYLLGFCEFTYNALLKSAAKILCQVALSGELCLLISSWTEEKAISRFQSVHRPSLPPTLSLSGAQVMDWIPLAMQKPQFRKWSFPQHDMNKNSRIFSVHVRAVYPFTSIFLQQSPPENLRDIVFSLSCVLKMSPNPTPIFSLSSGTWLPRHGMQIHKFFILLALSSDGK